MPVRELRRRREHGGEYVAALTAEQPPSARRTPRQTALLSLRFFGVRNPMLRTPGVLLAFRQEFGDELSSASWLSREIQQLERKQCHGDG